MVDWSKRYTFIAINNKCMRYYYKYQQKTVKQPNHSTG